MFKKTTLSNGLRVITAPMQGTNTVTVLVLCGTGSDYETQEQGGISHFLEHMFFKGTKNRPSAIQISQELDGMGSVSNAFTSHEITGYFIKAGKSYSAKSLDILSDIYKNSLFQPEEIEREKQVVIEELHRGLDTPEQHVWSVWETLLYGDEPAGREVIGTEESIRSFNRNNFADYFEHQYTALNTAVVVAGNFDEEKILKDIESLFSDIRKAEPVRKKPSITEVQDTPRAHAVFKETDQTHMVIGFRGYDAFHRSRYKADILASVLGSGMSSRMFSRIRERLGLAYAVSSSHESYSNRGFLVTYTGVDHRNAEKTIRAALDEYKKITEEEVSAEELRKVKDYVKGTTLISLESSNAVASFIGGEEMITGKPLTVDEVFDKIEKIGPEDVKAVAKDMIQKSHLNLALIGPFKESEPFKKILQEM